MRSGGTRWLASWPETNRGSGRRKPSRAAYARSPAAHSRPRRGLFVDASTPALFFGIAIGRLGCFFTGCCAGQCTRSRWGIWSSDRRVGARRIPTQLLESAAGLVLGFATLAAYLLVRPAVQGIIFLGALAAYTLARRILLRLRSERQSFPSPARMT